MTDRIYGHVHFDDHEVAAMKDEARDRLAAALRCTCTPPDGVTRNHANGCALFRVHAAYAQGWGDALAAASTPQAVDGLAPLITTILRKYGGTMKGRGDHDIFEALVRYRAALAAQQKGE